MWTLLLVIYDVANYSEYENVQSFISIQITIDSYDPPYISYLIINKYTKAQHNVPGYVHIWQCMV